MRIAPTPLDDALPAGRAPVLEDAREIAGYIEENSPSFVDTEMMEDYFHGGRAVLKVVPLADLVPGPAESNIPNRKRQKAYAALDAATRPPLVVLDDMSISDGHHRYRDALARGETEMACYVVEWP